MKEFVALCDWLLIFWRTAIVSACQHQTAIVEIYRNYGQDEMQKWFGRLLAARESGKLTAKEALLLQHEQLIMEQLGMPASITEDGERCTLQQLSKYLFAKTAETAKTFCDDERQTHLYFLIAGSFGADIYLNTACGLILHKTFYGSEEQAGVAYNNSTALFRLAAVHLVRGCVVNASFCTSKCAIITARKEEEEREEKKEEGEQKKGEEEGARAHSDDCTMRAATWLLLTFVNVNDPLERRQFHCDVAAIAYGFRNFVGPVPVPFHFGFFPVINTTLYAQFQSNGWPSALAPSAKYCNVNVDPKATTYYINDESCISDIQLHHSAITRCVDTFHEMTKPIMFAAQLWQRISKTMETRGQEKEIVGLIALLRKYNISRESAREASLQLQRIVDACLEAHNVRFFFQTLRGYPHLIDALQ